MAIVSSTLGSPTYDRLETPLKGRIFFDVFSILVESCGTDAAQFAPGERRFQHIRCIDGALGSAGPNDCVELIDEKNDCAGASPISLRTAFSLSSNSPLYFAPRAAPRDQGKVPACFSEFPGYPR